MSAENESNDFKRFATFLMTRDWKSVMKLISFNQYTDNTFSYFNYISAYYQEKDILTLPIFAPIFYCSKYKVETLMM